MSALRVPMIMQQVVPFVGLFAAMATLVSLNRKYELVIARAAGVSAWQFLLPACVGALLFGVLTVSLLNPLAAYGFSRAEAMETALRAGRSNEVTAFDAPWIRQRTAEGDTIIGARAVLNQGLELSDAIFFRFDDGGDIVERLDAKRALLEKGHWELFDVEQLAGSSQRRLDRIEVKTNLRPEFVQERLARPETIPFFDLPAKIDVARSFGLRANAFAHAVPFADGAAATAGRHDADRGNGIDAFCTDGAVGNDDSGWHRRRVSALCRIGFGEGVRDCRDVPPAVAAWIPVVVAMFFGVTFLLYKEDG